MKNNQILYSNSKFKPAELNQICNDDNTPASPLKVLFGRPNFKDLFKSFITPNSKEFHIYSTTSPPVNEVLFDTS